MESNAGSDLFWSELMCSYELWVIINISLLLWITDKNKREASAVDRLPSAVVHTHTPSWNCDINVRDSQNNTNSRRENITVSTPTRSWLHLTHCVSFPPRLHKSLRDFIYLACKCEFRSITLGCSTSCRHLMLSTKCTSQVLRADDGIFK